MPPMRNRTNTHGDCSRQNTRLTRPDWPQNGLSSETIATVHPQSATYGAVCRWLKGYDERSRVTHAAGAHAGRVIKQGPARRVGAASAYRLALRCGLAGDSRSGPAGAAKHPIVV